MHAGADTATPAAAAAAAARTFKHPGILVTQLRLETMRAAANSGNPSALKTGYAELSADSRSAYTYQHQALTTVEVVGSARGPQETRFKDDAIAAYGNAIRWVKTGNAQHRDKAIAIMNAWAGTFDRFTVASGTNAAQTQLEAAWMLPVWASAGEIIRHADNGAAGWSAADVSRFSGYLEKLYDVAAPARSRTNNWATSAALATMAVAVFQDDSSRFDTGLARLKELMPLAVFGNGEVNELKSRDCWHPQYSLDGLVQGAEIAAIQGDSSVWTLKVSGNDPVPRLAMGLEYMAGAILNGSGVRDCRGSYVEAGYMDIAVNGYMSRNIPIPKWQAVTKMKRPDGTAYEFLGWSTATHGRDDY